MSGTVGTLDNLLILAFNDSMIRAMETIYREPDTEDGALCLALVIEQCGERLGFSVDQDALVVAIEERWTADGWVKP